MPGTSKKLVRPSPTAGSKPVVGRDAFETSLDILAETFSILEGAIRVTYHFRKPVKVGWEHHNSGSSAPEKLQSALPVAGSVIAPTPATVEQLFALVSPLFDDLNVHFGEVILLISRGAVRNMQVTRSYRRDELHTAIPFGTGSELRNGKAK